MASRGLVAVSEEQLLEMQEMQELAAAQAGSPLPREVPSLPDLRARLSRGRDLLRRPLVEDELLPTALSAVDPLLAGGVARGCLTELRGALSSGRFGLVLALLAATTARGEAAALIDLGDQLDPQEAARCGVVLPRLLWARPQRLREALAAAEIALGGDFPLVVLELGMAPLPYGSRDEHAWLRLARAARLHRSALLVATPWRITGSAAGEVLALSRHGGVWIGGGGARVAGSSGVRLLAGVEARLVREKSRRQTEPVAAAASSHAGASSYAGSSYADLGLRAPSLLGALPVRGRGQAGRLLPEMAPRGERGAARRDFGDVAREPARPRPSLASSKQAPTAWPPAKSAMQRPSPQKPSPQKPVLPKPSPQMPLIPPDALPAYAARSTAARTVAATPAKVRPFASQL